MKPGVKTIISGALFILCSLIVPLLIALPLILGKADEIRFRVPVNTEFTAREPGRYILWNDYQTLYNGRNYNQSQSLLDGMKIQILDANGSPLELINDGSTSVTSGTDAAKSIGYVEIEHPGKLQIEVSGGTEDRVFSFGRSRVLRIVGTILVGIGASVLLGLLGVLLVVWGIIKMLR
jgi:hypothetical protein